MDASQLVESLRMRPVLVVIAGAGASHDSIASIPLGSDRYAEQSRPPLTQHLFRNEYLSEFLGRYGAARSLIAALPVDLTGLDLETLLNEEFASCEGSPLLTRRFVALRLYLRDLLSTTAEQWSARAGGATNYAWLAGEVEHWRLRNNGYVAWVTFNYDPLLEDALASLYGYDFGRGGAGDRQLGQYVADPNWCLIHVHGAARWTRLTSIPSGTLSGMNAANAVVEQWDPSADPPTESTIYQRSVALEVDERRRNEVLLGSDVALVGVPALSAPLASKASFECPPRQLEHLKLVLTQTDLILSVGWRAREPAFQEVLRTMMGNPPNIAVISKDRTSAEAVGATFRETLRLTALSPVHVAPEEAEGFTDLRRRQGSGFRNRISELIDASGMRRQAPWTTDPDRPPTSSRSG